VKKFFFSADLGRRGGEELSLASLESVSTSIERMCFEISAKHVILDCLEHSHKEKSLRRPLMPKRRPRRKGSNVVLFGRSIAQNVALD